MDYKFFIAGWLKRLALYRFDGIFSEFTSSIGHIADAKYSLAAFFKLLTNRKNNRINDCHPEERSDVRISLGAVRSWGVNESAISSLCGDCTARAEMPEQVGHDRVLFCKRFFAGTQNDRKATAQNDNKTTLQNNEYFFSRDSRFLPVASPRKTEFMNGIMFSSLTTRLGEKRC